MKTLGSLVCLCSLTLPLHAQDHPPLVVRHEHYFVVVNGTAAAPTITAIARSYGTYADALKLQILDDRSEVRLKAILPREARVSEPIPGAPAPLYLVAADPGYNGVIFDADRPWGVVAAGRWGLGTSGAVPQMYLYVAPECESFQVTCEATSPREGGRVTVLSPEGGEVLVMDGEFDKPESREVAVPAEHRGQVWSFAWARPQTVQASLDDMVLRLDGYLAPLLWREADWAAQHGPALWERQKAVLDQQQANQ